MLQRQGLRLHLHRASFELLDMPATVLLRDIDWNQIVLHAAKRSQQIISQFWIYFVKPYRHRHRVMYQTKVLEHFE